MEIIFHAPLVFKGFESSKFFSRRDAETRFVFPGNILPLAFKGFKFSKFIFRATSQRRNAAVLFSLAHFGLFFYFALSSLSRSHVLTL
jgi:hypothetical protein